VSLARTREWAREGGLTLLEAAQKAQEVPGLAAAGRSGFGAFAELIQRFSARAGQVSVGELLQELVEELDLLTLLREEGPDGEDRAENVKELIAGALDFDAEVLQAEEDLPPDRFTELDLFLQRVALVAETDLYDPGADRVTLMTLHNAKGLEFPEVFITGLEDGLFPLSRAYDDPSALEEERRLFYVGLTRAEDRVCLTHAQRRRRAGDYLIGRLSPFVDAIAPELLESRVSPRLSRQRLTGFGIDSFDGRRARSSSEDAWPDDTFIDQDFNQDLPRFVKGERVIHPTFGSGVVMEISGFGPDLKVTVTFDSVGRKKLVARYADLQKDFP
jgi:DNA helicase-2/ATP-dependent DNA helicase PcrA